MIHSSLVDSKLSNTIQEFPHLVEPSIEPSVNNELFSAKIIHVSSAIGVPIQIIWSESGVSASAKNCHGNFIKIEPQYLPHEFRQIRCFEHLTHYLKNACVYLSGFPSDQLNLYIHQRGAGGMKNSNSSQKTKLGRSISTQFNETFAPISSMSTSARLSSSSCVATTSSTSGASTASFSAEGNFSIGFSQPEELSAIEKCYLDSLIQSSLEGNITKELFSTKKLGDLNLENCTTKKRLIDAAGFYNYLLKALEKQIPPGSEKIAEIYEKLINTELKLYELCECPPTLTREQIQGHFYRNREHIQNVKSNLTAKITALQNDPERIEIEKIQIEISTAIKSFVADLVSQGVKALGKEPCKFALVGFGSLARNEMTLSSDLEFGILVGSESDAIRNYFENLTYLLHLKVVNLGETILPALIPYLSGKFNDHLTPRGLAFDGAGVKGKGCKTPFGNGVSFRLLQTPEKMAQYVSCDESKIWWFEKEPHLPMEILTNTFICGAKRLFDEYNGCIKEKLNSPIESEGCTLREHLAKNHLREEDNQIFEPQLDNEMDAGCLLNIKRDFYRLPHLIIERIALAHEIDTGSTLDKINSLEQRSVFNKDDADRLRWLIRQANYLRLTIYMHHEAQRDRMDPLAAHANSTPRVGDSKLFPLDSSQLGLITKMYKILIPLYEQSIRRYLVPAEEIPSKHQFDYVATDSDRRIFFPRRQYERSDLELFGPVGFAVVFDGSMPSLYDDTNFTAGKIASRLHQVAEAINYFLAAKRERPNSSEIAKRLGHLHLKIGSIGEAINQFNEALSLDNALDTKEGSITRNQNYYNFGLAYMKKGDYKTSLNYFDKVIKLEEALGLQGCYETVYYALGQCYLDIGNHKTSIDYYEKSLDLIKNKPEPNDPNLPYIYIGLSFAYAESGNFKKAEFAAQKGMALSELAFGPISDLKAKGYTCLAKTSLMQQKFSPAKFFAEKSLEIHRALSSPSQIADDLNNLGHVLMGCGDFDGAITKYLEGIDLLSSIKASPSLINIYINISSAYSTISLHHQSNHYLSLALTTINSVFHEDRENQLIVTAYTNLAKEYHKRRKFKQSMQYEKKALDIGINVFGENSRQAAILYNNYGVSLRCKKRYDEAKIHIEKALNIGLEIDEENHPDTALRYSNLGYVCLLIEQERPLRRSKFSSKKVLKQQQKRKSDALKEALKYLKKALKIYGETVGENHSGTSTCYERIGFYYEDQNNLTKALENYHKSLEINSRIFKKPNDDVAIDHNNLGIAYEKSGDDVNAKIHFDKAHEIRLQIENIGKQFKATAYHNMGLTLRDMGHNQEALTNLREGLQLRLQILPQQHPDVITSYNSIIYSLEQIGDYKEALAYERKLLKIQNSLKEDLFLSIAAMDGLNLLKQQHYIDLHNKLLPTSPTKTEHIFWLFYTASLFLANNSNESVNSALISKKLQDLLADLEELLGNPKTRSIERGQICVILTNHYFKQNDFPKAVKYGNMANRMDPGLIFRYRLIETVGMGENPAVEGEEIPCKILGRYYALKAHQTANMNKLTPLLIDQYKQKAKELLEWIEAKPWTRYKAVEIKTYAESLIYSSPNEPSISSSSS